MNNNSKSKWLGFGLLVIVLGVIVFLVLKFLNLFSGASDSIKATSITALVSVSVFTMGRYFEQRREVKQRINLEKVGVYRRFFDFYFDLMTYEKIHGVPISPDKVLKDMLDFQKDIIFWGTDNVIRAYLDFKDESVRFDPGNDDKLPERLAVTMTAVSKVLVEMRRDLGYSFTSLGPMDIARLQLSNDDETKRIFSHLKK